MVTSFVLPVVALTAVYLFVARLERRPSFRFRPLSSPRPYLATDVAWYGLAIAATAVSVFLIRPVLAHVAIGPIHDRISALPLIAKFALALVVFDLVSFLIHRQMHQWDALWQFHKVHHSTRELDGFATTRAHMVENFLCFVPPQVVLFVVGMPARMVAPVVATAAIYGVSNHSNLGVDLHRVEGVFVTPRLHRRHHVPSTTQSNFAAIFTVWDRLFGTLTRTDTLPGERYGVPGEIDTFPQRFAPAFRRPIQQLMPRRWQRALLVD